jgi:Flp pilus assembly pilin Flp
LCSLSFAGTGISCPWRTARPISYADARNSWSIAMTRIARLFSNQEGVGTIEYALIASLISIAAIAGYGSVGSKVEGSFSNTQDVIADNV